MQENLKILIVRLSALGDVVHSLPILHLLKETYPKSEIGWVVEDRASDLIINNPLVDNVYIVPKTKWKKEKNKIKVLGEYLQFVSKIRKDKYDIAIDLQELFKSGIITFLSGAKRRIAHAKTREFADLFVNEKLPYHDIFDINKPIIERYIEPAQYLGAKADEVIFTLPPVLEKDKEYVDELFANIDKSKPVVAISPATIWQTKHWQEDYWSELLIRLENKVNILFVGVEKDNLLINRISNKLNENSFINLAGKTSVLQLIEVFNRCDMLIAPDTGPTHIANATQKPIIICLFGATAYKRSGPYGEKHYSLSANVDCQPCFNRNCKKMDCMINLTVDSVYNIINETLNI